MCQQLQEKYGESPIALWRRPALVAAETLAREKRVLASQVTQLMRDCLISDELESVDSMSLEELEGKRVQLEPLAEERKAARALEMQKEEDARAKAAREEAAKQRKAKEERVLEARKARQEKEKREAQAEADYRARLADAGWELHHDEQGTP